MKDDEFDFSLWYSIIKNVRPITYNKSILNFSNQSVGSNFHNGINSNSTNDQSSYIKKTSRFCNLKPHSIDYNTKSKVDKGKYFLDDQLDLHGYSVNNAYLTLAKFITKHYHAGSRCLLIITGWGKKSNTGLIKNNLANWLDSNEIQYMVLYHTQATKAHGGKGAFYALLKRIKKQ